LVNKKNVKFVFLTGDIVIKGSKKNWDEVDSALKKLKLNKKVYFTVRNHDFRLFKKRYGDTYYYFIKNGDLFIVLDPNIDHWNISGKQLDFLKEVLVKNADSVNNIFVFFIKCCGGKMRVSIIRYHQIHFREELIPKTYGALWNRYFAT
jgi:3',5'-cyclic AMP phosphodiesterase CpdA